ncbi:MAG: PKD domain-containing protein, partial [Thermoplasmata archaeon]|nr:PKD domain-containing protein [Thermoplasmata archaeon]
MKAYAVIVVFIMLASSMYITGLGIDVPETPLLAVDVATAESDETNDFDPEPIDVFENDPMVMYLNAERADRGPYFLNFYQVWRRTTSVASIIQGEDYAKVFNYPYMGGQKVSSSHDPSLEATLDIYVNSQDVPGKTVRFKVEIDRNGDGINDTTIDFPPYTTLHNASPEHVVSQGTVYFREPEMSKDMSDARVFLKVWRTDTVDDVHNRLKIYCGFLSDTEMNVESKLILPWVNPVPHVDIASPLDRNLTGKFYFNNDPIFFDGRLSRDPSGEALGFVWSFDRLEYPPVYDKSSFNRSFKQPGWYTISLNVSNSLYFTNQTTVTIQVVYKNHPPKVTVQTANNFGMFDTVPDTVRTHTHVNTEWHAIVEDPDEDVVSLHWDFDDGFTSTSQYVNHSYKTPGEYLLEVEAFDGNETNGRVKKTILVIVEPNVEPVGVIDITAPVWEDITPPKNDPSYRGMEIRVNLGDLIVFDAADSYDPDGQFIRSVKWDFDDVYATEENPNVATLPRAGHRFLVEGEYNVTLTLFDGVKYGYLNVWVRTNNAPIVVPPATIFDETNNEITFDGSRSSDPDGEDRLQYKWDFGDNTRTEWSDSPFSTHTYKITATYTITLWVTDGLLTQSATTTAVIDPQNHPPFANADIQEDPDDLWTNMSLHFTSTGSYDIDGEGRISFTWDFDDGTDPSTLANPIHVFEDPGTYNVILTVIDQKNTIDTASLTLTIQRNYGDSDIIIKAVEPNTEKTFKDPVPDQMQQVAVMRTGWVAYLCDLKKDEAIKVKVTIIGERPADIYLFSEVHFQTYQRNPQVTFVPFEAKGYKQGATGEFNYEFTPRETDRYYIVIDNKDWPMGTETEGPVDYTVS